MVQPLTQSTLTGAYAHLQRPNATAKKRTRVRGKRVDTTPATLTARYPDQPKRTAWDIRESLGLAEDGWHARCRAASQRVMAMRRQLQEAEFRLVNETPEPPWYERPLEDAQAAFMKGMQGRSAVSDHAQPVALAISHIAQWFAAADLRAGAAALRDLEAMAGEERRKGTERETASLRAEQCLAQWPELLAFDFHPISVLHYGFSERYGVPDAVIGWHLRKHAPSWYPLAPLFLSPHALEAAITQQRGLAHDYLWDTRLDPSLADPCRWWANLLLPFDVFEERLGDAERRLKDGAEPFKVLAALRAPH